jgi:restriction endonuclease S subunit
VPQLSEIAEIRAGVTLRGRDATRPVADGSFHLIRIGDIEESGRILSEGIARINPREPISPDQCLRRDDVLVASRGSRNTAAVFDLPLLNPIAGSQFFIVRPGHVVDPRYLAWFLRSAAVRRHFDTRRKGSYVKIIQVADLAEIEIPLPPLEQQRQFVELADLVETERQLSVRLTDLRSRYFDHLISGQARTFSS